MDGMTFFEIAEEPKKSFIEEAISKGIERGFDAIGNKITSVLYELAKGLPEIVDLMMICYIIYLGYICFLKRDISTNFTKLYPIIMMYIIFKLVWKVILNI